MATSNNLQEAFAGESQANRKYLAFAKKAETEGYGQIAKLFRAAAAAETVHANAHLRAMNGIKTSPRVDRLKIGPGIMCWLIMPYIKHMWPNKTCKKAKI